MSCAALKNRNQFQVILIAVLTAQAIHSRFAGIPRIEGFGFLPAVSVR
jgi:hypothetical protein